MKYRFTTAATALLAFVAIAPAAYAQSGPPTGQNMKNNSGVKTPDETDANKRTMAPSNGTMQRAPRTSGSGATNTDSGTMTPDGQDAATHKTPGSATKPAPNPSR